MAFPWGIPCFSRLCNAVIDHTLQKLCCSENIIDECMRMHLGEIFVQVVHIMQPFGDEQDVKIFTETSTKRSNIVSCEPAPISVCVSAMK